MKKRLRSFSISVALLFPSALISPHAYACWGPDGETSIFFEEQDLKIGVDGEAVAKVTVTNLTQAFVGRARVDKVIKGRIEQQTITVRVYAPTFCTRGFGVGASGVVVGAIERDDQGDVTLVAIQESRPQNRARRKAHSMPTLR